MELENLTPIELEIYSMAHNLTQQLLRMIEEENFTAEERNKALTIFFAEQCIKIFRMGQRHEKHVKPFDMANMHAEPRDFE